MHGLAAAARLGLPARGYPPGATRSGLPARGCPLGAARRGHYSARTILDSCVLAREQQLIILVQAVRSARVSTMSR